MIGGYRQIIARAHARAIKVFGATIAPYEGAMYWSAEGELQRKAINDWIRHGGEFAAVLDFDATLRDPAKPTRMAEGKQMGDYLHGNDAGYDAIGNSIDLKLFR
jgi:lysophospholipase L1-like esterase